MHPRVEILPSSDDDDEDEKPVPRRVLDDEPISSIPLHPKQDDDPVTGRRKPGPKIAVPADFQPGVRVQIKGLVNARQYNGYPSVVILPTEKEQQENNEKGRVLVARPQVGMTPPTPNQPHLSLKPENLLVLTDENVDWRLGQDGGGLPDLVESMMTLSGHVPTRQNCDRFAQTFRQHMLWENISKAPQPFLLTFDDFVGIRLRDQGAHNVHFISMEQIGHSLVLETFQGRARLYQSCVGHYTAIEWMKGIMESRACARWGAKRQLNFSELRDLTDLIFKLQLLAVEIANVMFEQVPQEWKDKDNVAASDNKRLGKFTLLPLMKLCREWIASPPKPKGKINSTDPTKKQFYLELDGCDLHTPNWSFVFPDDLMKMFRSCYMDLVGVEVSAPVLVWCLHYARWKTVKLPPSENPEWNTSKENGAMGWSLCGTIIPKPWFKPNNER